MAASGWRARAGAGPPLKMPESRGREAERGRGAGAGAATKMPELLVVAWRGGPEEGGGGPKSVSKEEGI